VIVTDPHRLETRSDPVTDEPQPGGAESHEPSSSITPPAEEPGARDIALSTVTQIGARGLHLVLNVVTSLLLVRYLSPSSYGNYIVVISVATLFGLFAEFGLPRVVVKAAIVEPQKESALIGTAIVLRAALAVVAALLAQLLLFGMGEPAVVHWATLIVSAQYLSEAALTVTVTFQAHMKQHHEAVVRVVMEIVELAATVILIARKAPLTAVVAAPLAGATIGIGLAFVLAERRVAIKPRVDRSLLPTLIRLGLPVMPAAIMGVLMLKLDGFVLATLRPSSEVGWYGAAYQPMEYLFLASAVLLNIIYPLLVRAHESDRGQFVTTYRVGTETMLAIALPVPVVLALTAHSVAVGVFGADYARSALPLQILGCTLLVLLLAAWQNVVLLATGHQNIALRYHGLALGVSLIANLLLVSTMGYRGAAYAGFAANAVLAVCCTALVIRRVDVRPDFARLWRLALANLILAGLLAGLLHAGLAWPLAMFAAALSYPLWLTATGFLDVRAIRVLLAQRATPAVEP
jgi:O-antigen/teichoic acid export membrane protein